MKLKDLKQGMVCELRNGRNIIILNDNYFIDDIINIFSKKELSIIMMT